MVKHGFCADRLHRMFGLKPWTTGKLYVLSFPVCSRCTPEILALVELLSFALLVYNCLVTRYEPGKESSVSVCHNSDNLVNNRSRTQDVPPQI